MAEKTIVEKAAEAVGYGIAMAEDVAGSVNNAVGTAVTAVTDVLTKSSAKRAPIKETVRKAPAKEVVAKKAAQKSSGQEGRKKKRDKESCEKGTGEEGR